MVKTAFPRRTLAASSGVLLLATTTATTTTTTLPRPAEGAGYGSGSTSSGSGSGSGSTSEGAGYGYGSSSSSTSVDLRGACRAETTACRADKMCASCSTVIKGDTAAYTGCFKAAAVDGADPSTAYCLGHVASPCCLDAASQNECLENEAFQKHWMCALDAGDCGVDEIQCDDGRVGASSGTSA